jgi:predicted nucleic acid-binding protein
MAAYYLDASAIAKYYLWETGNQWVTRLLDQAGLHRVVSVELVVVEVVCALTRAHREGRISLNLRDRSIKRFMSDSKATVELVSVSQRVLGRATQLAHRHPLRAYDAIHLAAALELASEALGFDIPLPVFVSADGRLLDAAQAEGLTIENPSGYP